MREELKNHLAIRKRKGNLTNRSIELGLENLDLLTKNFSSKEEKDKEKIKIVQQSIDKGWASYFKVKENKNKKNVHEFQNQDEKELKGLYDN